VLKGIIEYNEVMISLQLFDPGNAVFTNGDGYCWKFLVVLQGFIANAFCCGTCIGKDESFGFATITTTENSDLILAKQSHKILGDRRFPASANGEITNTYHWQVKLATFEKAPVVTLISYKDTYAV
jgi:hypothetical protein